MISMIISMIIPMMIPVIISMMISMIISMMISVIISMMISMMTSGSVIPNRIFRCGFGDPDPRAPTPGSVITNRIFSCRFGNPNPRAPTQVLLCQTGYFVVALASHTLAPQPRFCYPKQDISLAIRDQ